MLCPFCGQNEAIFLPHRMAYQCQECGAMGPGPCRSRKFAAIAWVGRHTAHARLSGIERTLAEMRDAVALMNGEVQRIVGGD